MLIFFSNLMATVVYYVAASLLLAKVRVKSVLHFSPSIPFKSLIYSLLALGAFYCLRALIIYGQYEILNNFHKEDYYLRITLTSLPLYCIAFSSIASIHARKMLFKLSLIFLTVFFLLHVLIAGFLQKGITLGLLVSGFFHALCLSCIVFGFRLFYVLNNTLKHYNELRTKEIGAFRALMGFLPVMSLSAYVLLQAGITWPSGIFFAVFIPVHLFFIMAIIMKDTTLAYGGRWVEETQIPDSTAWIDLQEEHTNENHLRMEIYQRIKKYLEKEQAYRSPTLTRDELAARIGTNITYVSRSLNEYAGMNFKQFINAYRVKHAQDYFRRHPGARLIELCNESGFRSLTALNLAFRTNIGMTPGEWCRMEQQKINNEK